MQPIRRLLAALTLAAAAFPTSATIVIEDQTLVQRWQLDRPNPGGPAPRGWSDVIGAATFDTSRIEIDFVGADVTVRAYTNFPIGGVGSRPPGWPSGTPYFRMADFAFDLDRDGRFELGFATTDHDYVAGGPQRPGSGRHDPVQAGHLYAIDPGGGTGNDHGWLTPYDIHRGDSSFAGRFDVCAGSPADCSAAAATPVAWIRNWATDLGSFALTQTENRSAAPGGHVVAFTLDGVNRDGRWNAFNILWSTADCGNDTIFGQVAFVPPDGGAGVAIAEPAAASLLLVGLLAHGRRRRRR